MISKFGRMRDSLFTKIVLTITALSFMSLFGVSGYINTANNNKTVIKVGDVELTQSEFNYMLQREINKFKALTDDDFETNDEMKTQIANSLLKAKLDDAIIDNTMKKYHIDFKENFILDIIFSMPQFMTNGKFDYQQYKWYLNRMGMNEKEFVASLKRMVARKILLDTQVAYAKVPEVLRQQMQKVMGQRRTFKYAKIVAADVKISREPSVEELDQYYEDLKDELMVSEKRDVLVLFLSEKDLENGIQITDEEIDAYYKEHIDEFEQPEQRHVLQMVFDDENTAEVAYRRLTMGTDFMQVAQENGQKPDEVDMGYVAYQDVVSELADVAFALNDGVISKPIAVADSWQVIKVDGIKSAQKTDAAEARAKIVEELKQEKVYEGSSAVISAIEDKIGGGTALSEIAQEYNVALQPVNDVDEDGNMSVSNEALKKVLQNKDVLEEIFSYNEGEVTQTLETDDGIVAVQISEIKEAHPLSREIATEQLKEVWFENEKSSVVQELVDNIEHDFEAGDDVVTVAKRYNLAIKNTMPVTRSESIDDFDFEIMKELFAQPKNYPTTVKSGDDYVVAETTNIYDDTTSLSESDKQLLDEALATEVANEMSDALLKDFAADYKVEVNYNRARLSD